MHIKQISVFIENRPGSLLELTKLLANNNIDLIALSLADTTNFGILRAIVSDNEKAIKLITEGGYTANLTDVLAVSVPDAPGGLSGALEVLAKANLSVEYLYSFVRRANEEAVTILRVENPDEAQKLLEQHDYRLLSHKDMLENRG